MENNDELTGKIEQLVARLYNFSDEAQIQARAETFRKEVAQQIYEVISDNTIAASYKKADGGQIETELKDCIKGIRAECEKKLTDEQSKMVIGWAVILGMLTLGILVIAAGNSSWGAAKAVMGFSISGFYWVIKGERARQLKGRIDRVNNPEKYRQQTEEVPAVAEVPRPRNIRRESYIVWAVLAGVILLIWLISSR